MSARTVALCVRSHHYVLVRGLSMLGALLACQPASTLKPERSGADSRIIETQPSAAPVDSASTNTASNADRPLDVAEPACVSACSHEFVFAEVRKAWPRAQNIDTALSVQGASGAYSYLVDIDQQTFHAKCMLVADASQASAFAREIANAELAERWGLGAHIYYANASQGILVTEYLTPDPPAKEHRSSQHSTTWDLHSRLDDVASAEVARFSVALAALHALPTSESDKHYLERPLKMVRNVIEAAKEIEAAPGVCPPSVNFMAAAEHHAHAVIERLRTFDVPLRYCHGDAHLGNFIDSAQRPRLIDWADLRLGDPIDDLAYATRGMGRQQNVIVRLARINGVEGDHVQERAALYAGLYALRAHLNDSTINNAGKSCLEWMTCEQMIERQIADALR